MCHMLNRLVCNLKENLTYDKHKIKFYSHTTSLLQHFKLKTTIN